MADTDGKTWDPGWIGTAGIILLVIAVAWGAQRAYNVKRYSPGWPTCDGVVFESYVRENDNRHQDSQGNWHNRPSDYSVRIRYRYEVDGKSYDNGDIGAADPGYPSESEAAFIQSKYPVGAHVVVHYDPKHPGTSVLVPG
jgi:hypothetical protein